MNWDRVEGNWKQIRGNFIKNWGKLCGNPLHVMVGKREQLTGKIQEIYGLAKDKSGKQLALWHAR
jgi:uncharacterized protein YjbJ (UPF0337 family)